MSNMEKNEPQLLFNFSNDTPKKVKEPKAVYKPAIKLNPLALKRSVVAWLLRQAPSGMALGVPTRISKYKADIAAFWASPRNRLMLTDKTVIVELRNKREECWPDCSRHDDLLPQLVKLKAEKAEIEAVIRKNEPHLRDSDMLFDDFDKWDYAESENKKYHKCCRKIDNMEHAIYKGSRFEQIRRAHVANYLYLAVPTGSVHPHELADGWGLLYVNEDLTIEVIKEAGKWECDQKHKLHLVQNIASSNVDNLLFNIGIRKNKSGEIRVGKVPRRRRDSTKIPY
jgi:hypothetical protein